MNISLALMLIGVTTLTVAFVVAGIFQAIFGDDWVDKTAPFIITTFLLLEGATLAVFGFFSGMLSIIRNACTGVW